MKIVIDIGESMADVPAILAAMDGDGLTLTGVNGTQIGCRIAGFLREGCVFGPYDITPLINRAH
jgi:hypothetical protein